MLRDFPFAGRDYMGNWTGPHGIAFRPAAMTAHMEILAALILLGRFRFIGYLPAHYASNWVKDGQMKKPLPGSVQKPCSGYETAPNYLILLSNPQQPTTFTR